jgi:hypothetical protein
VILGIWASGSGELQSDLYCHWPLETRFAIVIATVPQLLPSPAL